MKNCPVCGTQNPDVASFCIHCGARLEDAPRPDAPQGAGPAPGEETPGRGPAYGPSSYAPPIYPRSIALAIVLTIITCGLYGFYWMYKVNEELNWLAGNEVWTGGAVILFDILTCHIYGIYWAYKMGQNCGKLNGDSTGAVLYLLLALFGFQIINLALFQDMINKCV